MRKPVQGHQCERLTSYLEWRSVQLYGVSRLRDVRTYYDRVHLLNNAKPPHTARLEESDELIVAVH